MPRETGTDRWKQCTGRSLNRQHAADSVQQEGVRCSGFSPWLLFEHRAHQAVASSLSSPSVHLLLVTCVIWPALLPQIKVAYTSKIQCFCCCVTHITLAAMRGIRLVLGHSPEKEKKPCSASRWYVSQTCRRSQEADTRKVRHVLFFFLKNNMHMSMHS